MESINKIRLKYYRKGESIHGITRSLGVSRNTVRKVIRGEALRHEYKRKETPSPKLSVVFKELLQTWLQEDKQRPPKERSDATSLFERLKGEGYQGAYDSVQRYVKQFNVGQSLRGNAFVPLSFAPGEAYQFDWSEEYVELAGAVCRVRVAQFRLCYSRKYFLIAYFKESQEMLFDAHVRAFEQFGGVPLRGIYDNLKTAVDTIFVGKQRKFNRRFIELMSHYLIEPVACNPAAGWEKGQVEKQVQDLRQWIFVPRLKANNLAQLNQLLQERCEAIAASRKHPEMDKTIAEVFLEEQQALKPLPTAFMAYSERICKVSSTCLVQVDRNRYSVDCHYANKVATVRVYANRIVALIDGAVIGEHERQFGNDKVIYNPWHYVPLLERKPGALRNGAPFKEWALPQAIETTRTRLLKKPGGDKDFVKLLQAIPIHGLEAIEVACELALEANIVQSDYVLNVIGRLRPGVAESTITLPDYFTLQEEPLSDCTRYNTLLLVGDAHA